MIGEAAEKYYRKTVWLGVANHPIGDSYGKIKKNAEDYDST